MLLRRMPLPVTRHGRLGRVSGLSGRSIRTTARLSSGWARNHLGKATVARHATAAPPSPRCRSGCVMMIPSTWLIGRRRPERGAALEQHQRREPEHGHARAAQQAESTPTFQHARGDRHGQAAPGEHESADQAQPDDPSELLEHTRGRSALRGQAHIRAADIGEDRGPKLFSGRRGPIGRDVEPGRRRRLRTRQWVRAR